jgi:hypothetical protein
LAGNDNLSLLTTTPEFITRVGVVETGDERVAKI